MGSRVAENDLEKQASEEQGMTEKVKKGRKTLKSRNECLSEFLVSLYT
jgi:hypothetical protein